MNGVPKIKAFNDNLNKNKTTIYLSKLDIPITNRDNSFQG